MKHLQLYEQFVNEGIDTKYWADYNTDTSGQGNKEFANKSKDFEEFIVENIVSGSEVWKHIKDITPERENIPTGFKKDIISRKFTNVDNFDMYSLLRTDPDFKEYYKSRERRYNDDDVSPRDLSLEIVVVDGVLLDGYSRVATLLNNRELTTNAFVS